MKITRAEADLIEMVRAIGGDPKIVAENIESLVRGFADINRYLCGGCNTRLQKIMMFRDAMKDPK